MDAHLGLIPFLLLIIPVTIVGIILDCFFWTTLAAPISLVIDPVFAMAPFFYDGLIEEIVSERTLIGWILL